MCHLPRSLSLRTPLPLQLHPLSKAALGRLSAGLAVVGVLSGVAKLASLCRGSGAGCSLGYGRRRLP